MARHQPISACRLCGNPRLELILDLGQMALTGVFPVDRDAHIDSGPIRLVKCHGNDACGLVQLEHTFDSARMYGTNYGYRSGLNPSMARHLRTRVGRILSSTLLAPGDVVLDIGSNDGTTLGAFPPSLCRVGVDPTASKFLDYYAPGIEVVPDFFSEEAFRRSVPSKQASVVTSFAMLYDLEDPLGFMRSVHNVLADNGVWVFEQSYLPLMLEKTAYDTICHEHVEYYSMRQIAWMADQVGLTLLDVELNDINGGSFCVTAARSESGRSESPKVTALVEEEASRGLADLYPYASFARRVASARDSLVAFFEEAARRHQAIGALGASTKGNVVLQYCGLTSDDLVAIGEVNEDKFGAFTPGSLIPIVPEQEVLDEELPYLLVLPWHFRETFLAKHLTGDSRLVFPLPQLEIMA